MNGALISGLTGLGFEYVSDMERLTHLNDPGDRTLSVKTHYPRLLTFPPEDFNPHEFMDSLVLVLRHPMNAIPSFLNVSKYVHGLVFCTVFGVKFSTSLVYFTISTF